MIINEINLWFLFFKDLFSKNKYESSMILFNSFIHFNSVILRVNSMNYNQNYEKKTSKNELKRGP